MDTVNGIEMTIVPKKELELMQNELEVLMVAVMEKFSDCDECNYCANGPLHDCIGECKWEYNGRKLEV